MKIDNNFHALITGGAGGIGLAVAQQIIAKGGHVYLVDVASTEKGQAVCDTLNSSGGDKRAFYYKCDVSDTKQLSTCFDAVVKQFGSLQLVFNNAGISERTFIAQAAKQQDFPKDWEQTLSINLNAVINGTRLAIRHHQSTDQDSLVIVNTASLGGLLPMDNAPIYCATKYAVIGFSRSLGYLKKRGIRVNALCPGFTDTQLVHTGNSLHPQQAALVAAAGPLLTPTQIADAVILMITEPTYAGDTVTITNHLGIAKHRPTPIHTRPTVMTQIIQPISKL